ncbi:unnamed protein product, partial [Mesorhabditis spiculigera]
MDTQGQPQDSGPFLPPIFRSNTILPIEAQLAAVYNEETNETRFEYSVVWEEEVASAGGATGAMSLLGLGELSEFRPVSSNSSRIHVNIERDGGVKCDGPCEQYHLPDQLTLVGRCDHYLCRPCSQIVMNADGSTGCSKWECYRNMFAWLPSDVSTQLYNQYVVSRQRDIKKAAPCCRPDNGGCSATPAKSLRSPSLNTGECVESPGTGPRSQSVAVRLLIFEPGPKHSRKVEHIQHDVSPNTTLANAIGPIAKGKEGENGATIYLVQHDAKNPKKNKLIPFSIKYDGAEPIGKFAPDGRIILALDLTGQIKPTDIDF